MKVHLNSFASLKICFSEKVNNFVKKDMIMAYVFVNILKIREFLNSSVVNNLRNPYKINMLEIFLENNLNLLRSYL